MRCKSRWLWGVCHSYLGGLWRVRECDRVAGRVGVGDGLLLAAPAPPSSPAPSCCPGPGLPSRGAHSASLWGCQRATTPHDPGPLCVPGSAHPAPGCPCQLLDGLLSGREVLLVSCVTWPSANGTPRSWPALAVVVGLVNFFPGQSEGRGDRASPGVGAGFQVQVRSRTGSV